MKRQRGVGGVVGISVGAALVGGLEPASEAQAAQGEASEEKGRG